MANLGVLEVLIRTKDETQKGIESAEKNTKKFGNKLSAWTIAKGQMLGNFAQKAISTTASVAKGIFKDAFNAFAEYEQIEGGIQTLFDTKTSQASERVMNYAKEAYRTAGISANQYMETVTAFSASLIKSLGGDTVAAADVADMAIIDMADNVNKMGSSMESVENAYKGFAKGNYTMLDNLKLGYGGTRSEMERLLKDASKLTGQKYDIKNLADVYKAIHAIQEEMGIAGATEKEAMTTVEGSFKAAKASWQDVLTSIGRGKDVKKAIKNFAGTAKTALKNAMPVVKQTVSGIFEGVKEIFPELLQMGSEVINELGKTVFGEKEWDVIVNFIKGASEGVSNFIEDLKKGFTSTVEFSRKLQVDFATFLTQLADGFTSFVEFGKKLQEDFTSFLAQVADGFNSFVDFGYKLQVNLVSFIAKLADGFGSVVNFTKGVVKSVTDFISDKAETVYESVVNFTLGLFKDVSDFIASIPKSIDVAVNFAKGKVKETVSNTAASLGEALTGNEQAGEYLGGMTNLAVDSLFHVLGFAKGSRNVPYDMPAIVHRGETILSASQARQYREGDMGNTSAIVSAIQGLRNDMANLKLVVGRKTFGRAVVDYGGNGVNDYIGGSESRAAAGYGT